MADPTTDALRNALADFGDALDPWIERLAAGDPARDRLTQAQTDIENASVDIAARQIERILHDSKGLAKIAALTAAIEAKAGEIDGREQSVAHVADIATKAISLATALGTGNVGAVLAAAQDVKDALA